MIHHMIKGGAKMKYAITKGGAKMMIHDISKGDVCCVVWILVGGFQEMRFVDPC